MKIRFTPQIFQIERASIFAFVCLVFTQIVLTQSVEQQFPTPVFDSQFQGEIKARDIGDARQTTYYYTLNGGQGDLFINIVTANLNGDIDIFIEQGLRPLTKIVVYADRGETETGRVIYLRKAEKLLMRIQGRTPNDDPGKFQFKFAGAFISAAAGTEQPPELPKISAEVVVPVKVNSSGAIIARDDEANRIEKPESGNVEIGREDETTLTRTEREPPTISGKKARPKGDPMSNFNLVVEFRDGTMLERPMTEVGRFQVDRGILTIINRNGSVSRYSMADVVRVSIE